MNKLLVFFLTMFLSTLSVAELKYVSTTVERIETCKPSVGNETILIFLGVALSGRTPSSANGCSNDVSYPYVKLNKVNGTITDFEKVILSTAMSALVAERNVRIRFEDVENSLISLAID